MTAIPTRRGRGPSGESARTDAQLLERIALEDLGALGELYDRHHTDVRRVLERVTRRSADVDDLVQATFLALQPLAGGFVGDGSARAWLCGIAVRLASRNERGVRRWIRALTSFSWSVVVPPPVTPETQASGREELVVLEQALWKMSAKKRSAFVLIEVQGLPVEEAARALQIPVASVRTRLFRQEGTPEGIARCRMVKRACDRIWEIEALREGRLSSRDAAAFERHRGVCAECMQRLAEDERIRELARQLPASETDPLHVRRLRAQILRRAAATPEGRPLRRVLPAVFAVLAIATTPLWLTRRVPPLRSQNPVESAAASFGATIDASPGARYVTSGEGDAEVVVLDEGTITLTVRHRVAGERFLVRVPDGELEVRGTRFQVVVASGALSSVQVFEGKVALRRPGAAEEILVAGRVWAPSGPAEPPPPSLAPAAPIATAPHRDLEPTTADRNPRRPVTDAHAEDRSAVQAQDEYAAAVRLFEQSRFDECARALHTFVIAHPMRAEAEDAAFLEASALARAGRADGAALVAERFLESYPTSIHVGDVATLATRAARDRADCKTARDLAERWIRPALRASILGRCAPRPAE